MKVKADRQVSTLSFLMERMEGVGKKLQIMVQLIGQKKDFRSDSLENETTCSSSLS